MRRGFKNGVDDYEQADGRRPAAGSVAAGAGMRQPDSAAESVLPFRGQLHF